MSSGDLNDDGRRPASELPSVGHRGAGHHVAGHQGAGLKGHGPSDPWEACPTGELTHMVRRLDAAQRWAGRKRVYRTALLSTCLFAGVVLAVGSLMGPRGTLYGGIGCAYCRSHFGQYQSHIAGQQDAEDADFVLSMTTHLEKCTFCREKFNAIYPDQRLASATSVRPRAFVALQPLFAILPQAARYRTRSRGLRTALRPRFDAPPLSNR